MKRITACLAGLLLGNLIVVPCLSEVIGAGTKSAVNDANSPREPAWEQARRQWALGCAAMLTERNHDNHTLLSGCNPSEGNKADKKRLLSDSWGINNREEFLDTMKWMAAGGHRVNFEKVRSLVAALPEVQYQALLRRESDPEVLNKLRVVRRYHQQLGDKSLYGWDYGRAICLCRWAYVAGYIEEKEAWEWIMPMAILLQEKFDSWEDLGRNYLIGRQFWSFKETQEDAWRYEDAFQRLLDMRSSPWNRYPWDMKLKEDENGGSRPEPQDHPEKETGLVAAR